MKDYLYSIMDNLDSFVRGMKEAVYWWHVVAFNRRIPIGACWLFAIGTIPINIIVILIMRMFRKDVVEYIANEMDKQIEEKEAN